MATGGEDVSRRSLAATYGVVSYDGGMYRRKAASVADKTGGRRRKGDAQKRRAYV